MLVRMLRTADGSPNGIEIRSYAVGDVYDVPEALGVAFVEHLHWAERFSPVQELETLREIVQGEHQTTTSTETAMVAEAPENTMLPRAPEDKRSRAAGKTHVVKKRPAKKRPAKNVPTKSSRKENW